MRRWIIWILILLVLSAGGFCLYWFVFRDTSDGGTLSNKEVLFAMQNVLIDNGYNLNDYVKDAKKVSFSAGDDVELSAESVDKKPLTTEFNSWLSLSAVTPKTDFTEINNSMVFAWKALYEHVFNKKTFRQNVWYEQNVTEKQKVNNQEKEVVVKSFKIKIFSDAEEKIYIWTYDQNANKFDEIVIDYNYRNEKNTYELTAKVVNTNVNALTEGENKVNTYGYKLINLKKTAGEINYYENVEFTSKKRYTKMESSYELLNGEINSLFVKEDLKKDFIAHSDPDTLKKLLFKYIVEDYDVSFFEFDKLKDIKYTKTESLKELFK